MAFRPKPLQRSTKKEDHKGFGSVGSYLSSVWWCPGQLGQLASEPRRAYVGGTQKRERKGLPQFDQTPHPVHSQE